MHSKAGVLCDGAQLGDFLGAIDRAGLAGLCDTKGCWLRGVNEALARFCQTPAQFLRRNLAIPAFERDQFGAAGE